MKLVLYGEYTREQVHDIFSPETSFSRGAGTWGVAGILPIPNREGDFVFLVSFGRSQGSHKFDEGISRDGVLRWQSQPKQKLDDPAIRSFISHDEEVNSIYLFLRTRRGTPYTFLGRLKYVMHERGQQQPVHFQWQLTEWPIPDNVLDRMGLVLEGQATASNQSPSQNDSTPSAESSIAALVEVGLPKQLGDDGLGVSTRQFVATQRASRAERDSRNRELGYRGECLIVEVEKRRLCECGLPHLAEKVRHIAEIEGDGAGYDVLSYRNDGTELFIEVKTTCGPSSTDFFISANEVAFSQLHPEQYELHRIFDFDEASGTGRFFRLRGDVTLSYSLRPLAYRVSRLRLD